MAEAEGDAEAETVGDVVGEREAAVEDEAVEEGDSEAAVLAMLMVADGDKVEVPVALGETVAHGVVAALAEAALEGDEAGLEEAAWERVAVAEKVALMEGKAVAVAELDDVISTQEL